MKYFLIRVYLTGWPSEPARHGVLFGISLFTIRITLAFDRVSLNLQIDGEWNHAIDSKLDAVIGQPVNWKVALIKIDQRKREFWQQKSETEREVIHAWSKIHADRNAT